jgi:mRNA interferase MazF
MITSADNPAWPDDVPVAASSTTGLRVPSLIRPLKIATIEARDADIIGQIPAEVLGRVVEVISRQIGLDPKR